MNTFIENSKTMSIISDSFITDSEFKELVYGLGISSDTYLRLSKKGDDRVYYALREWCKAIHTVDEFIQVLRKIGYHNLIGKLGYSSQPTQSCSTLGQLQNSRLTSLSPSYPVTFYTPNPDFDGDEANLYIDSNPFNFVEKKETMATFVNSNSPLYTKLCGIMDENGDWKTLAKNYGVLNNPAAAKLVLDLSAGWEKRTVHPTDRIFKLLIATPHGQRSLDQLSDDLLRIDNPQIVKWVNEWNTFRQKQDNAVKDANTSVYNANVELRQFLLQHKISKTENVDSHLARLTQPTVGVSEPEHLKMMEYNDFISAGFNIIESKMFVKAIATL